MTLHLLQEVAIVFIKIILSLQFFALNFKYLVEASRISIHFVHVLQHCQPLLIVFFLLVQKKNLLSRLYIFS
jgi:hypothetical protein